MVQRPVLDEAKYPEVAKHLANPSAIIFVGSGLSVWSGLPSWQTLLSTLLAKADALSSNPLVAAHACLANRNYLEAAEVIEGALGPDEIADVLRHELNFGTALPSEVHELITSFPSQCFVTTNFDALIENCITQRTGSRPPTVTNIDPADMPAVTRADATAFVFKPHGDIDRSSSIILSRQRYMSGITGHGSQAPALAALRIIMASRPIVFVGYSMSDLDFQIIVQETRDLFSGSGMPLWAIVPNRPENDPEHFRRTLGVRLVRYSVKATPGGKEDHSELISVLRRLHVIVGQGNTYQPRVPSELDFSRYGARLAELRPSSGFDLQGMSRTRSGDRWEYSFVPSLYEALRDASRSFILVGPAGSGKSLAIRRFLAGAGEKLRDWGLLGGSEAPPFPILLDARLYNGSFASLLETTVPLELLPQVLPAGTGVVLIIDSLDEMPSVHLESGGWKKDLETTISLFSNVRLVIASRRPELVPISGLDELTIHPLERSLLTEELSSVGLSFDELSADIAEAVVTPFLLKVALEVLPQRPMTDGVAQLLESFIETRLRMLEFQKYPDLIWSLSEVAYEASVSGNDTISVSTLKDALTSDGHEEADTSELNDLVQAGILVPEVGNSVRFVHRSILEYLASRKLVRSIMTGDLEIEPLLESRRWDDILVWSMNALDSDHARTIFDKVAAWDFPLAIRVARNSEVGRDALLGLILEMAMERGSYDRATELEVRNTTFPRSCKQSLLALSGYPTPLGESFAAALLPLLNKRELKDAAESFSKPEPKFPTGYAFAAITKYLKRRGMTKILDECELIIDTGLDRGDDSPTSLWSRVNGVLRGAVRNHEQTLLEWADGKSLEVLERVCEELNTEEFGTTFEFLLRQFDRGVSAAISPIFLVYEEYSDEALDFSPDRMNFLIRQVDGSPDDISLDMLRLCCDRSSDWSNALTARLEAVGDDVIKVGLSLALADKRPAAVAEIVENVLSGRDEYAKWFDSFDWLDPSSHWDSLLPLLDRPLNQLRQYLGVFRMRSQPNIITAERLDWVLDRLAEISAEETEDEFTAVEIGMWAASALAPDGKNRLIEIANSREQRRLLLFRLFLPFVSSTRLSTEDLSGEAQTAYLQDYLMYPRQPYGDNSPGQIASEAFIRNLVLPLGGLLVTSEQRARLNAVLIDASASHGVRYPLLDGGRLPESRRRETSLYYW